MAEMEEDDHPHNLLSLLVPVEHRVVGALGIHQHLRRRVWNLADQGVGLDILSQYSLRLRDINHRSNVWGISEFPVRWKWPADDLNRYLKFGRRPVMLLSMVIYVAALIGCSRSTDYGGLMTSRLFQTLSSGVCEALPVQLVNDIFFRMSFQVNLFGADNTCST